MDLCNKIIDLKLQWCFFGEAQVLHGLSESYAARDGSWNYAEPCRQKFFMSAVLRASFSLYFLYLWLWSMFGYAMYIYIYVNSATYHLFTKVFNQCLFIFSLATVSFLWISIGHVNHLHGQSFNILKSPRKRYSISNQRQWSTVYDMEIVCPLGVFALKFWERLIQQNRIFHI